MNLRSLAVCGMLACAYNANAALIEFNETQFNTDYASAGVGGLRGNGFGDIELTGVTGSIRSAYLYWHGPTNSTDPNFNANLSFNGTNIVGSNIGFSDDNFWDQANSQAYQADVTDLVSGDGTYSIAGLQANHSNGASLVVFYDDGDDSNNYDVVTFHGNDANFDNIYDPLGWNVSLSNILYTGGSAFLSMSVSDGQAFTSGDFFLNGVLLNPGFDPFMGLSVPQTPGSSVSNGGLWDIANFDITSFLTIGMNSLTLTHNGISDALSAIHFAVILPAGSAPDQPGDPVPVNSPASSVLLLTSLGLLALRRRKSVMKN